MLDHLIAQNAATDTSYTRGKKALSARDGDYGFSQCLMMSPQKKPWGNRVIVSFHGGAEGLQALHTPNKAELFMNENRGDVRRFAHAVVDAGADIVLGSGPHVVRGMEIYKDRLIAYSLGNFATYRAFNIWGFNGIGLILEADMDDTGRFISGKNHSHPPNRIWRAGAG